MSIQVVCQSCGRRLNAPDDAAGRKAKCPRCGTMLLIQATATVTASPSPRPKEPTPSKRRIEEPEERITTEPEETVATVQDVKKSKRKKRRSLRKQADQKVPTWIWWVSSLGAVSVVAGIMIVGTVLAGHGDALLFFSVLMAVMVPISTVILVLSMFISSWLGGGIEFGEAHIVIPKAAGLLFLVNLIGLLPWGSLLAAPIWLFGLMFLFGLDLWETRLLWTVNWGLNYLARLAMFSAMMTAFSHGASRLGLDGPPTLGSEQEQALELIVSLGGDFSTENGAEDAPVVSITLAQDPGSRRHPGSAEEFPQVTEPRPRLDPDHRCRPGPPGGIDRPAIPEPVATAVTDVGLARLKRLNQLETLTLTGTRVTAAGVADLRTALPRVRIIP